MHRWENITTPPPTQGRCQRRGEGRLTTAHETKGNGKIAKVSNGTTFILIAGVYHMVEDSEELGLSAVMVLDTNY